MSISEDEAEKAYSTEYWNDGSGCKKVFAANTDDLQEAYIRGREAPPSDVEVEAVAKDEDDAWDYAGEICGYREDFIDRAKEVLEVERHAVTE